MFGQVLIKARILATIDFRTFFERRLGRLTEGRGGWVRARCPFCNDRRRALRVDVADVGRGGFRCRRCQKSGDVFGFVMAQDHVPFRTALEILAIEVGLVAESATVIQLLGGRGPPSRCRARS